MEDENTEDDDDLTSEDYEEKALECLESDDTPRAQVFASLAIAASIRENLTVTEEEDEGEEEDGEGDGE